MSKNEARARIEKLKKLINHHRYLYHVLDKPEISDSALDSLKKELFNLEQKFPEFITPDSPTQRVGGKPLPKFEKAEHSEPMLSFNDAFSEKDMEDWLERISKLLSTEEKAKIDFYCELKIDGLAIELIYESGILKTGSTRGDGKIGENVTQNLKTIEQIPLRLNNVKHKQLIVRGEVFITKKEFEKVNKEQEKQGLLVFANPRNMAAGSVRQLDPKVTLKRRLDSFAYELITDLGQKNHEEKHVILKELGFKTNPNNKLCKGLKEVFSFRDSWQKQRDKLAYEIDGIVVIVNSIKIFEKLGVVGKAPRGAIAFKFPGKQATTQILDIKVQVGRTGSLTPVALLKPVDIGGVTVSRATLHNEDEIKRLGIKIGDTAVVTRAGDVVPDIVKVFPELRTGKEKDFFMPKTCPVCGVKIEKPAGEVVSRCSNPKCPAKEKKYLSHFISKGAFDMVGLGPKIAERLFGEGLIGDAADLFYLKEGDLLPLERFAEKSAKNLVEAIQNKKEIDFPRFIYALGIRNVGEQTSIDLAKHFILLDNLKSAKLEEVQKIKDVGPVVAKSIYEWFQEKRNKNFLDKLKKAGVRITSEKLKGKNEKFNGLIFVVTGTLETMTRDEAKRKIRELGGNVSESVSKSTNYLVAGKEPGSKYEKAKNLDVKIIGENELIKILK